MEKIFNFGSSPAMISREIMVKARELLAPSNDRLSVLEMSEKSDVFADMMFSLENSVRTILAVPTNYKILFMPGGQSIQYAAVPMNLLSEHRCADYIVTGQTSKEAALEAKRYGDIAIAASSAGAIPPFSTIPETAIGDFRPDADYVHLCYNDTIHGTKFNAIPETGNIPLVANMSSTLFTIPVDISKFGLIYAASHYNFSTTGMTTVIIREDLLGKAIAETPSQLNYRDLADGFPFQNVPPIFTIALAAATCDYIVRSGGVDEMKHRADRKASLLYDFLDGSEYYTAPADKKCRSTTNILFHTGNANLNRKFIRDAEAIGLYNLAAHPSVGGMCAGLYNSMPYEGVERLVSFMRKFAMENPKLFDEFGEEE